MPKLVTRIEMIAAELGYQAELCDGCRGGGRMRRADANAPTGYRNEDPCLNCDGTGRIWSMRGALPKLSDEELLKEYGSREPKAR